MLLNATINITPSSESKIAEIGPTGVFARMYNAISGGSLTTIEEQQSFTAFEVLQDFNRILRKIGVTNVISLSKDDFLFYMDEERTTDDLAAALQEFTHKNDRLSSELFKHLYLTLEHNLNDELELFIEIDVKRIHEPKESPITISVHGLIKEFRRTAGEEIDELEDRMRTSLFGHRYQEKVNSYKESFNNFCLQLAHAVKTQMKINKVDVDSSVAVIKPDSRTSKYSSNQRSNIPVMSGRYHNSDDTWLYMMLWMSCMQGNYVSAGDFSIISEDNQLLAVIDDEPIESANLAIFDEEVTIEDINQIDGDFSSLTCSDFTRTNLDVTPNVGDVDKQEDYTSTVSLANSVSQDYSSREAGSSSWLDDHSSASSSSSNSSSCGSSCGSGCGSC